MKSRYHPKHTLGMIFVQAVAVAGYDDADIESEVGRATAKTETQGKLLILFGMMKTSLSRTNSWLMLSEYQCIEQEGNKLEK